MSRDGSSRAIIVHPEVEHNHVRTRPEVEARWAVQPVIEALEPIRRLFRAPVADIGGRVLNQGDIRELRSKRGQVPNREGIANYQHVL